VGRASGILLWWVAATVLWLLVGGVYATEELVAGLAAGLAVALGVDVLRSLRLSESTPRSGLLREAKAVPVKVVTELRDLAAAAVRRNGGAYRSVPFPGRAADARSSSGRAFVVAVGTLSPKSIPIDVDGEARTVLVHDVRRERPSEEPL
jgi:multisubunit Na+/H+ antiporter MnhE subunit